MQTNLQVISDGKSSDTLRGTAAEFVQKKLKVNGVEVDDIAMSVFAKYGLVQVQGEAEKIPGKRVVVVRFWLLALMLVLKLKSEIQEI